MGSHSAEVHMEKTTRADESAAMDEEPVAVPDSADVFDATLRWIHEGRQGEAPVNVSGRPWLLLSEAVLLVLASSRMKVELHEVGRGTLVLTDATWKALNTFLGDAGGEGRLRLRGRRTSSDGELPPGEMEEIPEAYFAKDRTFF